MPIRSTRLTSTIALAVLLSSTLPLTRAATLTWDKDGLSPGTPNSAAGTWDTTNAYWSNGTVDSVWNNANKDTAVFGGSASYNVGIQAGGVTVGGLEFQNSGSTAVTLQTGPITLAEASVNAGVLIKQTVGGGSASAVINSKLTGTANVTFTAVNVTLGAVNDYVGTTKITAGNLRLGVNNALPTGTDLTINGGSIMFIGGTSQTVNSLSGASGGRVWGRLNASSLKINGAATTTYAGSITNDSGKVQSIELAGSGQLTLTHTTGLTYNGTTTVSETGTLKLGTGAHLINTSAVIVSGGSLTSTSGNINLGAGAVSMSAGNITPAGIGTVGSFTLALNQNFTTTDGTLNFDIGGSFDQIIGSGTGSFNLTGTTLALNDGGSTIAGTYLLFSGFGGANSITDLTITGLDAGFIGSLGTDGILTISAIPEPSTFAALAGAAFLGFAALRRRRA